MSNEDKIKEILQQFKNILQSYVGLWDRITIDAGHREDAPEYKFDRRQMTDPQSNLFAMVGSLFMNKPLSQALQQIDFWRVMYIETGISKDKIEWGETDEFKGWAAIGQAFLDNARAVAARWCVDDVHPQGEQPQGGGGIDHQNKVQQNKTQTEIQKSAKGKGRPKETLQDKVVGGDTKLIADLHSLIDGKRGKDVALYIVACMKLGKLTRPTYTQIVNEFGDIGSKAGYNRYLDEKKFTTIELEGAMNQIKGL